MISYAKITDEKTKQVSVGIGTNTAFYEKIGMTQMEVEKAYNGAWYVKGYAPDEPEEERKARENAELIKELEEIDFKTIRSLRAIQSGNGTEEDTQKLSELEQRASEIRSRLQS